MPTESCETVNIFFYKCVNESSGLPGFPQDVINVHNSRHIHTSDLHVGEEVIRAVKTTGAVLDFLAVPEERQHLI